MWGPTSRLRHRLRPPTSPRRNSEEEALQVCAPVSKRQCANGTGAAAWVCNARRTVMRTQMCAFRVGCERAWRRKVSDDQKMGRRMEKKSARK